MASGKKRSSGNLSSGILSSPLVKYVLMAALRDKLVISLMLMIVVGASLSVFLGTGALMEDDQFALVFAASGLRFTSVIGLVLFVVFFIRRSFDNKDVEFLLARPVGRDSFILSHALAFSILALAMALAVGVALCLVSPAGIGAGHPLWLLSLFMELVIIVNAALFFSMVLSSASGAAMAVFGLYVLSRLIGQLLGIADHQSEMAFAPVLNGVMNLVSMIIPRLDLLAQTSWIVYPDDRTGIGYGFVIAQGVFYAGLLVVAALVDLRRRQF